MKKIIIVILFVLFALPCTGYEGKTLSLSLSDRPLYELLDILREKGELSVVYSKEMLCKGGKPVTINLELRDVKAELVLEVAAKAGGFSFEKKESIYIILPIKDTAAETAVPEKVTTEVKVTEPIKQPKLPEITIKEPVKKKKTAEIRIPIDNKQVETQRYTGNFMYGQGDKIYLNLVIPEVNEDEIKRITQDLALGIKDGKLDKEEAVKLFGRGSEMSGKDIGLFTEALRKAILNTFSDGKLSAIEIHRLRNGFINAIRNNYEGM
jgi:hypothetical protein